MHFSALIAQDNSCLKLKFKINYFDNEIGKPYHGVSSLAVDSSGYLWVGSYENFLRFEPFQKAYYNKEIPKETVSIFIDSNNRLWQTSSGKTSLYMIPDLRELNRIGSHSIPQEILNNKSFFYKDQNDESEWISTSDGRLFSLDDSLTEVVLIDYSNLSLGEILFKRDSFLLVKGKNDYDFLTINLNTGLIVNHPIVFNRSRVFIDDFGNIWAYDDKLSDFYPHAIPGIGDASKFYYTKDLLERIEKSFMFHFLQPFPRLIVSSYVYGDIKIEIVFTDLDIYCHCKQTSEMVSLAISNSNSIDARFSYGAIVSVVPKHNDEWAIGSTSALFTLKLSPKLTKGMLADSSNGFVSIFGIEHFNFNTLLVSRVSSETKKTGTYLLHLNDGQLSEPLFPYPFIQSAVSNNHRFFNFGEHGILKTDRIDLLSEPKHINFRARNLFSGFDNDLIATGWKTDWYILNSSMDSFQLLNNYSSSLSQVLFPEDKLMFAGTANGFVFLLDKEYQKLDSIYVSDEPLKTLTHIDSFKFWAGTRGNGIYKISYCESFGFQILEHYLADRMIFSAIKDFEGDIWVSTESGPFFFQKESRNFVDLNNIVPLKIKGVYPYSIAMDSIGGVYLGTQTVGLIYINATEIKNLIKKQEKPRLFYLSFFNSKSQEWIKVPNLNSNVFKVSPYSTSISIRFTSSDWSPIYNKLLYSIPELSIEEVSFSGYYLSLRGLARGAYTINFTTGPGNPAFYQMKLIIPEPWYLSNYAKLAYALIIFLIGAALVFARQISLVREKNKLASLVEQRTGKLKEATENLRKSNEKLQKMNDSNSYLISILGHELRAPTGYINRLASDLRDLSFSQNINKNTLVQLAEEISRYGNSLIDAIDNLMHWGLSQRDQLHQSPDWIEIYLSIVQISSKYRPLANSRNIDFRINNEISKTTLIYADGFGLNLILSNLVSNSIKFTPNGGQIELFISLDKEKGLAIFKLSDTGPGIPNYIISEIEGMTNIKSTRGADGQKGIGLGLKLVAKLIRMNDASIKFENTNPGLTIYLFFRAHSN